MESLANALLTGKRRGRDSTERVAKYFTMVADRSSRGNNTLKCGFCNKEFKGSSTRMRGHLAGSHNGVSACPSVPDDVKADCRAEILTRKDISATIQAHGLQAGQALAESSGAAALRMSRQDHEWVHKHFESVPNPEGNRIRCCSFCKKKFMGSATRMRSHLAGTRNGVAPCGSVPDAVKAAALESIKALNELKTSREQLAPALSAEAAARLLLQSTSLGGGSASKRQRLGAGGDAQAARTEADLAVANFLHLHGVPMEAASGEAFKTMAAQLSRFGSEYAPSCGADMLKASHQAWAAAKEKALSDNRDAGLTLTTVAVQEPAGSAMCIVAVTWKAPQVLSVSRGETTAEAVLAAAIESMGGSQAVPLVLLDYDPTGDFKPVAASLESRFPSTSAVCCASQVIQAIIQDVAELPGVKQVAHDANCVVQMISANSEALSAFQAASSQPLPTLDTCSSPLMSSSRTAAFLESFTSSRLAVQSAVSSCQALDETISLKVATGLSKADIDSEGFWERQATAGSVLAVVREAAKALEGSGGLPPPSLAKVYSVFSKLQGQLTQPPAAAAPTAPPPVGGHAAELREAAAAVVDRHWTGMRHDCHAAAYALDPQVWDEDTMGDSTVSAGFYRILAKVATPEELQDATLKEYRSYKAKEGVFGMPLAQRQATQLRADEWWQQFGAETPNLRKLAIRILNQVGVSPICSPASRPTALPAGPPSDAASDDDLFMLRVSLKIKEVACQQSAWKL